MRHNRESNTLRYPPHLLSIVEGLTLRPGSGNPIYQDCLKALGEFRLPADAEGDEDDEDDNEGNTYFLGIGMDEWYRREFGRLPGPDLVRLPFVITNGIHSLNLLSDMSDIRVCILTR